MPPMVFEPKISAGERPHTYALDRAATGNGSKADRLPFNSKFALETELNVSLCDCREI
jgi:hypothetical protein